ncbi:MAG: insulinase family protein [Candidatus Melainabacteria bacterium]|uniref:Insulinase family protein n=1 Tax=Candidatus Obscuribacter phosphatis TaxID=1906157 RepID=A0A8J7TNJ3_9BACT|nr:insulinase family protein [Candidatus Obscuribacter phosphatis]MCA0312228.1 insulinase family protein [Candidatus Melainabacteria bacterium]OPZ91355.1 MAG: Peptidase M16 inactive domain protein [bacterium ADurb.Bin425]
MLNKKLNKQALVGQSILLALAFSWQNAVVAAAPVVKEKAGKVGKSLETKNKEKSPKETSQPQALKAETIDESFRKSAPVLPKPRPFTLPKIEKHRLSNGLEVQFLEDHRFPFTSFNFGFKTGSAYESKDLTGVADATAKMLNEGTETLSSKALADKVEFMGGAIKASADYDYSILSASCLSAYNQNMLDLLGDVLLHPSFPEDELKLFKVNSIQALAMKRAQPDFLVEERFSKVVFGNHPYSLVSPSESDINKLTRSDLVEFHHANYVPNNAVLIIVGDVNPSETLQYLEKTLAKNWLSKPIEANKLELAPEKRERKIHLVDRPGSVQTSIRVGNLSIRRDDPDYYAMLVANQILGGTAHARLFMNIREDKGYTYGAYSRLAPRREPGAFFAKAEVRTEVTNPSLLEFIYELTKMRTTRVKPEELNAAKNYLAGSFQLGLETQAGIAQRLLEANIYNLSDDYLEKYADKIMAVNEDDVQKAAQKLINENNLVICVVGDAGKIKNELSLFAPVAVYDTDGKLK